MDSKNIDALAVVLKSMIVQDKQITQKEMQKFTDFFVNEFNLNQKTINELFEKSDVDTLSKALQHLQASLELMEKMSFMNYINQVIISDSIDNSEYELFEEIKDSLL
jgi:uncharacterized tellurite resistance protein B-like protein